jgi:hypothetical protein
MNLIIAVDPGASGGIAWAEGNAYALALPMPHSVADVIHLLRDLIRGWGQNPRAELWLEDIPKFVGKAIPASSAAVLFRNFGYIEGAATALGLRVIMVKPHDWQKHFKLGTKKDCASTTEWKNKLKSEAVRRFPNLNVTLKTADALLILDFAKNSGAGNNSDAALM